MIPVFVPDLLIDLARTSIFHSKLVSLGTILEHILFSILFRVNQHSSPALDQYARAGALLKKQNKKQTHHYLFFLVFLRVDIPLFFYFKIRKLNVFIPRLPNFCFLIHHMAFFAHSGIFCRFGV